LIVFRAISRIKFVSAPKTKKDNQDTHGAGLQPNHPPGTARNLVLFAYERTEDQL
jgi:hypothetical protein